MGHPVGRSDTKEKNIFKIKIRYIFIETIEVLDYKLNLVKSAKLSVKFITA